MKNSPSPEVAAVIQQYPQVMQEKLLFLRTLIFETASELDLVNDIEETLKWGEPAYLCKTGSTIRMDRLNKNEDQYAMFFNCKTSLVDTFKELYKDIFIFSGNRAIIFDIDDVIPVDELKHCISLSLIYHKVKHLSLLGA